MTSDTFFKRYNNYVNSKLNNDINLIIRDVSSDIKFYRFNVAIARIRTLYNLIKEIIDSGKYDIECIKRSICILIRLLNPFIPHITEELWEMMGNNTPLYQMSWPTFDLKNLDRDSLASKLSHERI